MKYNPASMDFEDCVCVSYERFAELIRKEERLNIVLRLLENNEYCTVKELKVILGVNKENTDETV